MKLTINGKPRDIAEQDLTVAGLVAVLGAKPEQVAVAVNGEVVRRADWALVAVREGDNVEVVRAVGGGRR